MLYLTAPLLALPHNPNQDARGGGAQPASPPTRAHQTLGPLASTPPVYEVSKYMPPPAVLSGSVVVPNMRCRTWRPVQQNDPLTWKVGLTDSNMALPPGPLGRVGLIPTQQAWMVGATVAAVLVAVLMVLLPPPPLHST